MSVEHIKCFTCVIGDSCGSSSIKYLEQKGIESCQNIKEILSIKGDHEGCGTPECEALRSLADVQERVVTRIDKNAVYGVTPDGYYLKISETDDSDIFARESIFVFCKDGEYKEFSNLALALYYREYGELPKE